MKSDYKGVPCSQVQVSKDRISDDRGFIEEKRKNNSIFYWGPVFLNVPI